MMTSSGGEAPYDFEAVLNRCKREIEKDISEGVVPPNVSSFSQLHDYVDANCYGGAEDWAEEEWSTDEFCNFWNRMQGTLDLWLRTGRPGPS